MSRLLLIRLTKPADKYRHGKYRLESKILGDCQHCDCAKLAICLSDFSIYDKCNTDDYNNRQQIRILSRLFWQTTSIIRRYIDRIKLNMVLDIIIESMRLYQIDTVLCIISNLRTDRIYILNGIEYVRIFANSKQFVFVEYELNKKIEYKRRYKYCPDKF